MRGRGDYILAQPTLERQFLRVADTANLCGVSENTAYRWLRHNLKPGGGPFWQTTSPRS